MHAHTSQAVVIHQPGGPQVLQLTEVTTGDPGEGEIRIRHKACGLNFIDIYHRSGLYPLPLPATIGMEAAGIVEAVGKGVNHLQEGDRVAYATGPTGAYCQVRVMAAQNVCRLPDSIAYTTAAAMMLKGLTVQYLLHQTQPQQGLQPGDHILLHAAAGGVGLIACQWAKAMGLQVIGTAGSDEKCALAIAHGASWCINYTRDDFVAGVQEITAGKGVKVCYDSVGAATFIQSLDCLRPLGLAVNFGNASGKVPPFDIGILAARGSLYVTRPTLMTFIDSRQRTQQMADDLFAMVTSGKVGIQINQQYPLADIQRAHQDLEGRVTTGSSVLLPDGEQHSTP